MSSPPGISQHGFEFLAIEKQQRINEQIRISPIRVISADGAQLGIIPTDDALSEARTAGLDLVEVAPNERPPVCRIMDYGKFKYNKRRNNIRRTFIRQNSRRFDYVQRLVNTTLNLRLIKPEPF